MGGWGLQTLHCEQSRIHVSGKGSRWTLEEGHLRQFGRRPVPSRSRIWSYCKIVSAVPTTLGEPGQLLVAGPQGEGPGHEAADGVDLEIDRVAGMQAQGVFAHLHDELAANHARKTHPRGHA